MMSEMNRREFVTALTIGGACACCSDAFALAEPTPAEGNAPPRPSGGGQVDAGPLTQYAKDGVWDKLAKSDKVLIARSGAKIYAMTAICTHKSCTVRAPSPAPANSPLACPCHHSRFSIEGKPTGGPARAALFHLGVSIDDQKHLIVDKTKQFGENEWDKDGAFVKGD
jgi:Rieske Fe-S protein